MANLTRAWYKHPLIVVPANFFTFCILGYLILGQTRKALDSFLWISFGSIFCFIPGIIMGLFYLVDTVWVAQDLADGKEVDENEYRQPFAYRMGKTFHTAAVFKG